MNSLGYEKIKVILDRGFFSAANMKPLKDHGIKISMDSKGCSVSIVNHIHNLAGGKPLFLDGN